MSKLCKFLNGGLIYRTLTNFDSKRLSEYIAAGWVEVSEEDYEKLSTLQYYYSRPDSKVFPVVPVEPALAEVKEIKIAEMKAERDRREQLPIEYNGISYDYDLKSAFKLDKARTRIRVRQLENQPWIDANSGIQALTAEDIDQIDALAADRSNALHMQYAQLKVYIAGLEDVEAVKAVSFDMEIPLQAGDESATEQQT